MGGGGASVQGAETGKGSLVQVLCLQHFREDLVDFWCRGTMLPVGGTLPLTTFLDNAHIGQGSSNGYH